MIEFLKLLAQIAKGLLPKVKKGPKFIPVPRPEKPSNK